MSVWMSERLLTWSMEDNNSFHHSLLHHCVSLSRLHIVWSSSCSWTGEVLGKVGNLIFIANSQVMIDSLHSSIVLHLFLAFEDGLHHVASEVVPLEHDITSNHSVLDVTEGSRGERLHQVLPGHGIDGEPTCHAEKEGAWVFFLDGLGLHLISHLDLLFFI